MQSYEHEIRSFVVDNFLFGRTDRPLTDNDSLIEKGIIDSTGVLELVTFLEDRFKLVVEDDELVPDNLDSISRVAAFIQRKLQS